MFKTEIGFNNEKLTVRQGDVFTVASTLEFGDGRTLETGDVVTVANISKYPDGVHFEFCVDGEPGRVETIMKFALEKNLEENHMDYHSNEYDK